MLPNLPLSSTLCTSPSALLVRRLHAAAATRLLAAPTVAPHLGAIYSTHAAVAHCGVPVLRPSGNRAPRRSLAMATHPSSCLLRAPRHYDQHPMEEASSDPRGGHHLRRCSQDGLHVRLEQHVSGHGFRLTIRIDAAFKFRSPYDSTPPWS